LGLGVVRSGVLGLACVFQLFAQLAPRSSSEGLLQSPRSQSSNPSPQPLTPMGADPAQSCLDLDLDLVLDLVLVLALDVDLNLVVNVPASRSDGRAPRRSGRE
jgi:hypothetical protein